MGPLILKLPHAGIGLEQKNLVYWVQEYNSSVLENVVTRPFYFLLTEAEESKSTPETVEFDKERIHLQTKGHYSHFWGNFFNIQPRLQRQTEAHEQP